MSRKKSDIPLWAKTGHQKPITRRDFLASGVLPFAASIIVPNWASMLLSSTAHAQSSPLCEQTAGMIPFVTLNLSGGAAMASNFVPMNAARQRLPTYNKLGLGNNQLPIELEFGNVPFAGMVNGVLISKFLEGLRSQASADTRSKTAFIAIPCDSQNDSGENKFDISGAIAKAGLIGTNLPNLGTRNSRTGINQRAAIVPPPSPLIVSNYSAILNSVGYSSSLARNLNTNQKSSLAKLISNLNSSQSRDLAAIQGADGIKNLIECAGIKNVDVIQKGASAVDPRQNVGVAGTWGINATTATNNRDLIFGSMVYNSLLGQAGSANLELGGYDYHDNSRTTGDTRDREAGVAMGRILQTAALLQKPVFLYVVSDGSVYSADSDDRAAVWVGDRGSSGVAYLFYYDPTGRPKTSDYQIGQFNDNQAADPKFITGSNPEATAAAVFANWCQANKRMDLFEKIAGRIFDPSQLNSVIKVA